jgi:hypothetical protein
MPTRRHLLLSTLGAAAGGLSPIGQALAGPPRRTLAAYQSEDEYIQALQRWRDQAQRLQRRAREQSAAAYGAADAAAGPPAALSAAPAMAAKSEAAGGEARNAAQPQADGITNVQTAGVDEGGIVKQAGSFLVILRRGRLFTVRVGGNALEPVDTADAYAPGSNPQGAWYDELLVSGDTVVVVGYSYARGGTEIGLFHLDRQGGLRHEATHHLRSFDYYSSRNYASRLIGRKLIFYTPSPLTPWQQRPWEQVPAVRRWRGEAGTGGFRRILPATRIYRTDDDFDPAEPLALHTVTQCDLDAPDLDCESIAVLGPAGRVFYVSQSAVYVWTAALRRRGKPGPPVVPHEEDPLPESEGEGPPYGMPRPRPAPRSLSAVFRIPLDGETPTALKTAGVPVDQLSFLEDDGHLNVLLRESGPGEGMWGADHGRGSMALLRVALSDFGDGDSAAGHAHYRQVPAAAGGAVQNRFVGDWLLWGGAASGARDAGDTRGAAEGWALRYAGPGAAQPLRAGHAIERIEALGRDAVLVGNDGADLCFTSVDLARPQARIAGRHVHPQSAQAETRTHGFFYRPAAGGEGLLGLPVLGAPRRRRAGVYGGGRGAAAVLYLRQRGLQFSALGRLEAAEYPQQDDGCKASCVDWYGNSRPIFLGGRVLALLGYEMVEGRIESAGAGRERIEEVRRISFAPHFSERDGGRAWPFN